MKCLKGLIIKRDWIREFLSEFISTFVFILIGEAAFAHYIFKKEHDVFAVVFCWGIAVMLGLLTGASNSGGHINPIVTTGLASIGKFPWKKVPHYLLGQHLGSFVACAVLYGNYAEYINHYDGGNRQLLMGNATGILWTTYPDVNVSLGVCVYDTIICSGMLMFGILVILDDGNGGVPKYLHSFYIGLLVMAVCWAFGTNCMAGINPARDFPPRVFSTLIGFGSEPFSYRNFWWIPMFVPHLGGSIGCFLYELTIGIHKPEKKAPIADIRELKEYVASSNSEEKNP